MDFQKIREILDKRTSINSSTGCWEYLGINSDGYGQVTIDGVFYYVHRLSAVIFLGYDLNSDLHVLHENSCHNRCCWNPEHLYVSTNLENIVDRVLLGTGRNQNSDVTECKSGHEFTESNTYWAKNSNGKMRRQCKTCKAIRNKYKDKRRKGNR